MPDKFGRTLIKKDAAGDSYTILNIASLPKGIYSVQVTDAKGNEDNQRFLKEVFLKCNE